MGDARARVESVHGVDAATVSRAWPDGLTLCDDLRAGLAREARSTAETIDWERVNDSFAEALIRAWRSGKASVPAAAPLRTREAES